MEKEQYFYSNLTPTSGGVIHVALGALVLIGAIRRWEWIFDMTGQRNGRFNFLLWLYDVFGEKGLRVGLIINAIFIMRGGIWIMLFRQS